MTTASPKTNLEITLKTQIQTMKHLTFFLALSIFVSTTFTSNLQAQTMAHLASTETLTIAANSFTTSDFPKPKMKSSVFHNTSNRFETEAEAAAYPRVATLIDFAEHYVGTPYKRGGSNSKGFDNSGYIQYVFQHGGHFLKPVSKQQAKQGKKISFKKVQKGDLLFFGDNQNRISHVGLVVSEKDAPLEMIHVSPTEGVQITNIANSDNWKSKLQVARRVLTKTELKMVNAKDKRTLKKAAKKYWKNA